MKRIFGTVASVALIAAFAIVPFQANADTTVKKPANFVNVYGFEDLKPGVNVSNTDDVSEGGMCINDQALITVGASLDVKIKKVRAEITDQGAEGNGYMWGAGEKSKNQPLPAVSDNQRFWNWYPSTISVEADAEYSDKIYKNATDFCFYIDTTHLTTQERIDAKVNGTDIFEVLPFVAMPFIGDDGVEYKATFSPIMNKSYYLQDDNGDWVEKTASVYEPRYDKNSKGDPIICGFLDIPLNYKGYVRVPFENFFPVTYYDATPAEFKLTDYRDKFQLKEIQLHAGFYPEASGAEGDFKGGYVIYDNFGILTDDGSTAPAPIADEPTVAEQPADESKEQESKEDTSKVEESKEDTSKVDDTSEVAVATEETTKNSSTGKVVAIIIIALVVIGGVATYISFAVKKKKKILGVTQSDSASSDDEDSKPDDDTNPEEK